MSLWVWVSWVELRNNGPVFGVGICALDSMVQFLLLWWDPLVISEGDLLGPLCWYSSSWLASLVTVLFSSTWLRSGFLLVQRPRIINWGLLLCCHLGTLAAFIHIPLITLRLFCLFLGVALGIVCQPTCRHLVVAGAKCGAVVVPRLNTWHLADDRCALRLSLSSVFCRIVTWIGYSTLSWNQPWGVFFGSYFAWSLDGVTDDLGRTDLRERVLLGTTSLNDISNLWNMVCIADTT